MLSIDRKSQIIWYFWAGYKVSGLMFLLGTVAFIIVTRAFFDAWIFFAPVFLYYVLDRANYIPICISENWLETDGMFPDFVYFLVAVFIWPFVLFDIVTKIWRWFLFQA